MFNVIIDIGANLKLHFRLFLLNAKYYQNEIWSNPSASFNKHFNMFLAQCWRLETSSRLQ